MWESAQHLLSENKTVVSAANLFGVIAGIILIYNAATKILRFAYKAIRSSLSNAIFSANQRSFQISVICSRDIHICVCVLLGRLIIATIWISSWNLIPFAGLIGAPLILYAVINLFGTYRIAVNTVKIRERRHRQRLGLGSRSVLYNSNLAALLIRRARTSA